MIFTFYSYKGGVGRSMALANVGHWLAHQGLRVLLVDWDLEAPGLENYFAVAPGEAESIRSRIGVIDLLQSYLQQAANLGILSGTRGTAEIRELLQRHLPPISTYTVPLQDPGGRTGSLSLLPAGLRTDFPRYAEAVQSFKWDDLYTRCHGEEFFEWLRSSADGTYDVVLVDSRTGVTEMGSVCTRQLADVVVSFCAPNISNLHGVVGMAQSFIRDDLLAARGRPLQNVIVPARVEMGEQAERSRFRDTFAECTEPFLPQAFRDNELTFWGLRVPYVPFHAYREELTIGARHSIEELADAYKNVAAALVLLAPEDTSLHRCCQSELSRVLPLRKILETNSETSASALSATMRRQLQHIFESVPSERKSAVLETLSRFLWIDPATGDITQRRVASAHVHAAADLKPFIEAGLMKVARDGGVESVSASDPLDLTVWKPLRDWAVDAGNREFLLSRQTIQQLAQDWERAGRDDGVLMRGAVLARAAQHWQDRAESLTAAEHDFIRRSQQAEAEAAKRDARRRARARAHRRVIAASILTGAVALGAWSVYSRTVGYTIRVMRHDAAALLPQAPAGTVDAWAKALVLAGAYRDAFDAAGRIRTPAERALAFASVAEALAMAESAEQANTAADEAIAVALTVEPAAPVLAGVAERLNAGVLRERAVRAARLAIERHDPSSEAAIETTLSWGRILMIAGQPDAARAYARAAIEAATKASQLERLNALTSLAAFPWDELDEPLYLSSLQSAPAAFVDPVQRAYAWADVARAMSAVSATAAAEAAAREAHAALKAVLVGPDQGHRPVWFSQIAERLNESGQRETAVTLAREAVSSVRPQLALRSDVEPARNTAVSPQLEELGVEALTRAAAVLALNDRLDEAHIAVEVIPQAATRAAAWVSIAEQLRDGGRRNEGIEAAQMAAQAAVDESGDARGPLLMRAADVLAHLNRPDDARRLLERIPVAPVERTTGKGVRRSLAADLADIWATLGEYKKARVLASQAAEADRLRPFAAILFEYSRSRNPRLSGWLDPKRSTTN